MAKKITLAFGYKPDFNSVGIYTTQKDYRICWLLNQNLGLGFIRVSDFFHSSQKDIQEGLFQDAPGQTDAKQEGHAVFMHFDANNNACLSLIANKGSNGWLFPEHSNLDYLLVVNKPGLVFSVDSLIQSIKKIPQVTMAFPADGPLSKKINDFYFDFELYLTDQEIH